VAGVSSGSRIGGRLAAALAGGRRSDSSSSLARDDERSAIGRDVDLLVPAVRVVPDENSWTKVAREAGRSRARLRAIVDVGRGDLHRFLEHPPAIRAASPDDRARLCGRANGGCRGKLGVYIALYAAKSPLFCASSQRPIRARTAASSGGLFDGGFGGRRRNDASATARMTPLSSQRASEGHAAHSIGP
jgi:hypothetical protein